MLKGSDQVPPLGLTKGPQRLRAKGLRSVDTCRSIRFGSFSMDHLLNGSCILRPVEVRQRHVQDACERTDHKVSDSGAVLYNLVTLSSTTLHHSPSLGENLRKLLIGCCRTLARSTPEPSKCTPPPEAAVRQQHSRVIGQCRGFGTRKTKLPSVTVSLIYYS